ncbi:transposase [Patescibacteria group bacterium]|nr:transposase [Patescibacteria group bacterium]
MRDVIFLNNHWYHICNRGVEKRKIFIDEGDYERFVCHLYEFNDTKLNPDISFERRKQKILELVGNLVSDTRDKFVEIAVWSLVPNHFHLLIRQIKDNGVSLFLHKLGIGYTKGFNKKYERVGSLFQGSFKARLVDNDEYFRYLFYYILSHPLELLDPQYKEKGTSDYNGAIQFLKSYKWSAYSDLICNVNFPAVINKDFIKEFFDEGEFKIFMEELVVSETKFPTFMLNNF